MGVLVGSGELSSRIRESLLAKQAGMAEAKVDYMGFANFMAHLLDWGLKLIVAETLTPVDFLAYQYQVIKVSEAFIRARRGGGKPGSACAVGAAWQEHGGIRTAFEYDLRMRRKIAIRRLTAAGRA